MQGLVSEDVFAVLCAWCACTFEVQVVEVQKEEEGGGPGEEQR